MTLTRLAELAEREHLLIAAANGYALDVSSLPDKLGAIGAATVALQAAGVAHALIGGLAVGIRSGVPRATLDIDFAVPSTSDRRALEQALTAAGFTLTGAFQHSLNFRHMSGEPLQLAMDIGFDPMIARAEGVSMLGFTLRVVTKADLIEMKRRAAADPARRRSKSLRDQADILLLEGDVPDEGEGW
jgi:hypothetical protein